MASCPRCGSKGAGFFKLCAACKNEVTLQGNLNSKSKNPPIHEPEDDE